MQSRSDSSRLSASCLSSKSQEYIPSGISSLDSILNGGYPLGALVLIEEDELQLYSNTFVKYFLAEGFASKDCVFLASRDIDPLSIITDLPPPAKSSEDVSEPPSDELKIAWRYKNNSVVQSSPGIRKSSYSHDFDFNTKLSENDLNSSDCTYWPKDNSSVTYHSLFDEVCSTIYAKNLWFGHETRNLEKKILRICICSIGSPFWCNDDDVKVSQTLFKLRTVIHNSASVALVTLPSHIIDKKIVRRCEQISDIVISLRSLVNNTNKQYCEYNGLMTFLKIAPINSMSIHVPEDRDWAFKLKKKKLIIEKIHLPPESDVTDQREQDDYAPAKKLPCQYDF